jgi:hypothetical protein
MSLVHFRGCTLCSRNLLFILIAIVTIWMVSTSPAAAWNWDGSSAQWFDAIDLGNSWYANHWGNIVYGSPNFLDWPRWNPSGTPPRMDAVSIDAGVCYVNGVPDGPQMATLGIGSGGTAIVRAGMAAWMSTTNDGYLVVNSAGFTTGTLYNNTQVLVQPLSTADRGAWLSASQISGSGVITLNATGIGAGLQAPYGSTMTIDLGHTVHGNGSIDAAVLSGSTINHGLIQADTPGALLYWFPQGTDRNDGILRAINGGVLQLRNTLDNTNGTIRAEGGDVQLRGANISGGLLSATGGSRFQVIDNAGTWLNNLTIANGTLVQNINGTMYLGGTVTNNGSIVLDSAALPNNTALIYQGTVTLAGNGSLQLRSAPGWSTGIDTDGGTLISSNTIHGSGWIFSSVFGGQITNNGSIIADDPSAQLVIDPNRRGKTIVNNTWLGAKNGAVLRLQGPVDNTNGILTADGGDVQISGARIGGGTITTTGTSTISLLDGSELAGPTITGGSNVQIPSGHQGKLSGSIVNDGMIACTGDLFFWGGSHSISGNGVIQINGSHVTSDSGNGTVTIGSGQTLRGCGEISSSAWWAQIALVNHGLIQADIPAASLTWFDKGGVTSINDGAIRATNGSILQLRNSLDNTGGTILADGGDIQFNGGRVSGGTIATARNSSAYLLGGAELVNLAIAAGSQVQVPTGQQGKLTGSITNDGTIACSGNLFFWGGAHSINGNGAVQLSGGTVSSDWGNGTVTLGPGQTLRGYGAVGSNAWWANIHLDNQGTVEANGGTLQFFNPTPQFSGSTLTGGAWIARAYSNLAMPAGGVAVNQANVILDGLGSVFSNIDSLSDNRGSFAILNGRNFTTLGSLANTGIVSVGAGSTLTVQGNYTQTGNGFLDIEGAFVSAMMSLSGGTLGGSGTIHTPVVLSGGALAPGSSPGTLTIDGNLSLQGSNVYAWQVASASLADKVLVNGDLTLSGQIALELRGFGSVMTPTDFELFHFTNLLSDTASWDISSPDGTVTWEGVGVHDQGVWLNGVRAVPEPATLTLLAGGVLCLLSRATRRRRTS